MDKLKGWKTIIVSVLALIWAILPSLGIDLTGAETANVELGVLALAGIVLRYFTDTSIGDSS